MTDNLKDALMVVNSAIVATVLPQAYQIINDLIDAKGAPSKELIVRARRLLPATYSHGFGFKP